MTPAARLQAAIELYGDIIDRRVAADRTITSWFRTRRFAGSGDRRAITELVYTALRRRGELAWSMEADTARLVVLRASGEPVERLVELCSGTGYAPAVLDAAEQAALATERSGMSVWARVNCPEWLWPKFVARFGDTTADEIAALAGRAPLDLRVNTLKATRDAVLASFAADGIAAEATPLSPTGIRLEAKLRLDANVLFLDGQIEPQDEAAQLASLLVDARPGMTVVDACAGAGGKTLALAATMRNEGKLIALDRDRGRLARLKDRAARAGATLAMVDEFDAAAAALAGKADRVLLDVPCSGTGTWRRNPEARWHLTPEDLDRHRERQADLLRRGAGMVASGGRLIYATCSVLPEEDEAVVDAFLAENQSFSRAEGLNLPPGVSGPDLVLTPLRHGTDGFFTAVLQRRA